MPPYLVLFKLLSHFYIFYVSVLLNSLHAEVTDGFHYARLAEERAEPEDDNEGSLNHIFPQLS